MDVVSHCSVAVGLSNHWTIIESFNVEGSQSSRQCGHPANRVVGLGELRYFFHFLV